MKSIVLPNENSSTDPSFRTGWWHESSDSERIVCDLCPRECSLKDGDRGFCFVRQNVGGRMALTTYGLSTGFCIDPIEKKPLNHFLPGTPVLSFGTAGCNLGCQFCQNWDISKSRQVERLSQRAMPEQIAETAVRTGCRSVACTYNDPIIWAEYAIDTARACRERGIHSVAVTAGYITPAARPEFFHSMDAANVDLKAFSEEFYHRITYSHLQPVLDTLKWLKHESDVWFEITNLVIPDANDSPDEIRRMCDWILESVGSEVPVHFTAFHPDFRMTDRQRTPHETLIRCRELAMNQGLKFVYVGNVDDVRNQSTRCPGCGEVVIERNHYELGKFNLKIRNQQAECGRCGRHIPGHFEAQPGTWGRKRQPVQISDSVPQESMTAASSDRITQMNKAETSKTITTGQEAAIHQAACEIVSAAIHRRTVRNEFLSRLQTDGTASRTVMGAFVTLKRNGQLRACCGVLGEPMPLLNAVHQAAVRTATEDRRLPPISPSELRYLTLDVTLLSDFEEVTASGSDRAAEIEVGRHGLKIVRGRQAGLLLPSVPVEHGWDSVTFLNQVCRKAGLPVTAWQDTDSTLLKFEGHMLEGPFDRSALQSGEGRSGIPLGQQHVDALTRYVRHNLSAALTGAIPACFGNDVPDCSVSGIVVRLSRDRAADGASFSAYQWYPELPLQTTLLQMTRKAAEWLSKHQLQVAQVQTDCMVLSDPAMHGTVQSPSLEGLDTALRAVMIIDGSKRGVAFDPSLKPSQLVELAIANAQSRSENAAIYSFTARSSSSPLCDSNVPRPQPGPPVRPPAVAGTFYPDSADQLRDMVDQCFSEAPVANPPQAWSAAMVPHAGLVYSGRIAAGVLASLQVPRSVIIIGPKHTRHGVDWAVAPHETWSFPGGQLNSNRQLADALVNGIDGLQADAAAHAGEHSIEVILPLLAKVAPEVQVVGIVMGGGSLARCRQFARQLAEVLKTLNEKPLLLISSDMNHFAADDENRRLDQMALTAMESGRPDQLHQVVTTNAISMCGVLPAVVVMETLHQLGGIKTIQRCGYATSADVGASPDRVVGYAGMLLK
ncbi:MAG: AmmeMemoRadiSam system radical SAM enzyme [Planctomycetaceae bacterium]